MKKTPANCDAMMAELAREPGVLRSPGMGEEDVRRLQHEKMLAVASKHGVRLADAENALLAAAIRFHADDWVTGLNIDRYRLEYEIRSGACNVWGLVVRLLREVAA